MSGLPLGTDVKIINLDDEFGIDVKRFNVPASVTAKCPHCGAECETDLSDEYLSYPDANKAFDMHMYCTGPNEEDDHEFRVRVKLVLKLELVP